MMMNSTQVLYFILIAYFDTGPLKYLYFMIVLFFYTLIISFNVFLIVVICMNRSLHEPMYIFLCSLFVNELFGSTGLFPFLLVQILSDVHTVSASVCYLQIFCVYSYGKVEFFNLAIISYDRYLAICYPLHYNRHMTFIRVIIVIALIWFLSFVLNIYALVALISLRLCGNILNKVHCPSFSIVKLACSDTRHHDLYGLVVSSFSVYVPLLIILYTYMKILHVCFSGSKQTRHKAVSTCTPHLASLLNFSFGVCFEILQSRYNMNNVPNILRILLSLYFLTCPPLFNPIMYGLKLSKIRVICKSMI
nr:olfactory receptor 11A1-like [Labrus bergylta]